MPPSLLSSSSFCLRKSSPPNDKNQSILGWTGFLQPGFSLWAFCAVMQQDHAKITHFYPSFLDILTHFLTDSKFTLFTRRPSVI